MKISIIGAGSWGSALAVLLSLKYRVNLYTHNVVQLHQIQKTSQNIGYLPKDIFFSNNVIVTNNFDDIVDSNVCIVATPSSALREILTIVKTKFINSPDIIILSKGFELTTSFLPHQVYSDVFGNLDRFGSLVGPSFAQEVAYGLPTAITLASSDRMYLKRILDVFTGFDNFRVYPNMDLVGCELGGSFKNIIAIAVGISDGLKLGYNARAALMTRSLNEISHLLKLLGGDSNSLFGLTGIGDLILTCTGDLSRNRQVGLELSNGLDIESIKNKLGHVAEGVLATKILYELSIKKQIELPITKAVFNIIYNNANINEEIKKLLTRELRFEFE